MQVMDLLQLHHTIKEPEQALAHVGNQAIFDRHVQQFKSATEDLAKPLLGNEIYSEQAQALALLFFTIYPMVRPNEIIKKYELLGVLTCDVGQALFNCKRQLSNCEVEQYTQAMPAITEEFLRVGTCTHAFLVSLGLRNTEVNPDGKADKSQRCMLLTCAGRRQAIIERNAAVVEAKKVAEEKAREKEEKKERSKRTRETKKANQKEGEPKTKRTPVTQKIVKSIRSESKGAAAKGNDDKCTSCDSKWSVFEKYAEKHCLFFRQCSACDKYYCGFCVESDVAMASAHEPMCRRNRELEAAAKELLKVNQQLTAARGAR